LKALGRAIESKEREGRGSAQVVRAAAEEGECAARERLLRAGANAAGGVGAGPEIALTGHLRGVGD
jgi:hypothetical protein